MQLSDSQSRASSDVSIMSVNDFIRHYPGFTQSSLVNDFYSHFFCNKSNQPVDTTIFAMEIGPVVHFPRSFKPILSRTHITEYPGISTYIIHSN